MNQKIEQHLKEWNDKNGWDTDERSLIETLMENKSVYTDRSKLFYAIAQGIIKRDNCFICGETAEAHHEDYLKPLDVMWVCPEHHRKLHRRENNDN